MAAAEEAAEAAAAEGNAAFRSGDFPGAIAAWTRAIEGAAPGLRARCLGNLAQAWLQLREYGPAERDCAASLRLEPGSVKVWLRRATALLALERVEEAKRALDRALGLRPPPSLLRSLQQMWEQARIMSSMLEGPGGVNADAKEASGLVDEAQTLRLSFRDGPPHALPWGAWSSPVSLFLSNEFGLWRRADFPGIGAGQDALPLEFAVFDQGGGYCAPSATAQVEVAPVADEQHEDEGVDSERTRVVLRRNTSCRVRCRVRFWPKQEGAAALPGPTVVHLCVGLPPSLLTREVLLVVSLPIHLLPPSVSAAGPAAPASEAIVDTRLGITGCRTIYLPALRRALLCAESPGQAGIAGKVWDAGLVLTHYLAAHLHVIAPPKTCIELGAGTGAAGIAAALLGAQSVVVTDLESVVPLIQRNIDLNIPSASFSSSSPPTQPSVAVAAAYAWGGSKAALGAETFDTILLADVIYDPKYYSALVQALRDLSHPGTVVTLAHRERHPDAALFFAEVRRHFAVERVPFDLGEGQKGQGEAKPRAACTDVQIFELRPLPASKKGADG